MRTPLGRSLPRATALAAFGAALVLHLACTPERGTPDAPLRFLVVPSQDAGKTRVAAQRLADRLSRDTGLTFTVDVPSRYIDLVVALGEARADLAFMNDMGYILARDEYDAHAVLAVHRGEREDRYWAIIVVHADSGLTQVSQLEGKRIAYVDVNSISGYILPAMLLRSQGVSPSEIVKAGSHEEVVRRVLERNVDAGFTYLDGEAGSDGRTRDARARLVPTNPDVFEKVRILARTEPIPNEPLVFGRHVPQAVRDRVVQAMLALIATSEGREIFSALHEITGLTPVTDEAYNPIRDALKVLGKKPDELEPGGGILLLKRQERLPPIPPIGN